MLTKLDGIRALYLELAWEQGEHDTGYGGAIKALGATLAVAEAAADIVRVMTPIEHPKSPTDYAYGKVTNEQWRALVATIAPLLEEAE